MNMPAPFRSDLLAQKLFFQILDQNVSDTTIRFLLNGSEFLAGRRPEGKAAQIPVTIHVHRERFFPRTIAYGNLGLGEAYIDGDFDVVSGSLEDFLTILIRNHLDRKIRKDLRLSLKAFSIRLLSILQGIQRNVQYHYDLGDELFESFLDSTLTYSCGYVKSPNNNLDQLQADKLERICQKLQLRPNESLLDIGCGYGGLLIHAAKHYGVRGVGITISQRHFARGNANIERERLSDRLRIEFCDYRSLQGSFDKVVSVGMMEHVPRLQYAQYIGSISKVLTPEGMGLIHTIGCNSFRNEHDPFIQKYIFPGSNQPRLSEVASFLERHQLAILDVENIIRHYAFTVRKWLERFRANKKSLDSAKYNEAFLRTWEYYLCCGIAAAIASDTAVYQILFTKDCASPIPLQRV